jgi:histidinol-phosphate aminotransferase
VNGIGQIAAETTLGDLGYYRRNFRRIIATRKRVSNTLGKLGFEVLPSQTNFIFVRPPFFSARDWLEKLRAKRILVRWWDHENVRDYLRITIGTDKEMSALLRTAKRIISKREKARR